MLGRYATDTSGPLTEGLWPTISCSAQTAIEAGQWVVDRTTHRLRPVAAAGTFRFPARPTASAPSGKGLLDIFYVHADVFVCSPHVDPSDYPTYHPGQPDEAGTGPGTSATLNLRL